MKVISEDMQLLEDPIEAIEFMINKKGVVHYTGSGSWKPTPGELYPVEVPEIIWSAGEDQTLAFLEKELSGAKTIIGVLF